MADAGIGEIALVALTAASTAYQISQSSKTPNAPKAPETPSTPTSPTMDVGAQNKIAQQQAQSAAGTILSPNPGEGQFRLSNDPLTPRKTLLGN